MFLNKDMEPVGHMSHSYQANGNGDWSPVGPPQPIQIEESGYICVFLSSRGIDPGCTSCGDVYFDDLWMRVHRGAVKEEAHYYPYGLPMRALSAVLPGQAGNRHRYQGKEHIEELGLGWMDFHARQYDPQIGRFLSVDPLGDASGQETYGTYAAMGNMPESTIDPDGMRAGPTNVYSASPFTFGPMQHIALMFPSLHLYMPNWQIFSNGPESSVAALLQRLAASEAQQNGNARRSDSYDVPDLSAILGPGGATRCYHGGSSGNTNDGDSPEHWGPDKNTNMKKELTLSEDAYGFIIAWEDFGAEKYDANPGKGDWTIGYGHKIKKGENFDGRSLTKEEALALLKSDMVFHENRVKRNVKVSLSQQQYDALVIFDMNVRGGLSRNTTITDAVNRNADMGTMQKIWYMYSSPNDPKIHQGVLNRRMDEFQIWQYGNYTRNY